MNWRGTGAIPLVTVQAVIKRLQSRPGHTIEEAAKALGKDVAWMEDRITDGTVRLLRQEMGTEQLYLSEPMMRRLRDAEANPRSTSMLPTDHLRLGEAAFEAGVTPSTIMKWADCGDLERLHTPTGWQYPRDAVRARARLYLAAHSVQTGHAATMAPESTRSLTSIRLLPPNRQFQGARPPQPRRHDPANTKEEFSIARQRRQRPATTRAARRLLHIFSFIQEK